MKNKKCLISRTLELNSKKVQAGLDTNIQLLDKFKVFHEFLLCLNWDIIFIKLFFF
jgi:hypothetical protein